MQLPKWINDCITEDDGKAVSGAKLTAYTSVGSYLGMAAYALHKAPSGDLSTFNALGSGLAFVLAGAGALIAGTQSTMNKPPMNKPEEPHDDNHS
jgi:hypothetical protein